MPEPDCTPERCSCAYHLELCDGCACFRDGYEASGMTCERTEGAQEERQRILGLLAQAHAELEQTGFAEPFKSGLLVGLDEAVARIKAGDDA